MNVQDAAAEIITAINVTMDSLSSPESRRHAYEICENFKSSSPLCISCGLLLSSTDKPPIVRHFGLQLIEHTIKFKWNDLKQEEKCFVKNNVLQILSSGTNHILEEHSHIKDMLARIVVEMIKREWPQQWPNMLQELNSICLIGETQTELVLLIFLRLAEDLAMFPCIPNRRRKEIQQVLSLHLKDLLSFFLKTLCDHYPKYIQLISSEDEAQKHQALVSCKLAEAVLNTLVAFVEWVPWSHITADDNALLKVLCNLLVHNSFRLLAVECLLLIVGRKGKVEDRLPLLVFFSEDAMSVIFSAASSAADSGLLDEQPYLFFKKLCELLINLGIQLAVLWGTVSEVKEPPTFKVYLNSILTFTEHPSMVLNHCAMGLWLRFLQHSVISKNEHIFSLIPKLMEILAFKLLKVGYPSQNNSPSCAFSCLDFDSDEEFFSFFTAYRSNLVQVLQCVTNFQPVVCFAYGAQLLKNLLESSPSNGFGKASDLPLPLQLDAVSYYLETVCNRLYLKDNLKLCPEGVDLLKMLLQFETQDTAVLSAILSCMSALFIFLKLDSEVMPLLLTKLFNATAFTLPKEPTQDTDSAIKDCRRHAAACIVKICKDHSKLLLPAFDQMYSLVKNLNEEPDRLYHLERCLLLEALVLISNEFCDFHKQSSFLGEVLKATSISWETLKKELTSTEAFISFVGLRNANSSSDDVDVKGNNKLQITNCLSVMTAVLKRSKWPDDLNVAENGGFLVKDDSCVNGHYLRHPATQHFLQFIDGIFALIKYINSLHEPSILSSLPGGYDAILEMPDAEKKAILGIIAQETKTSNCPRLKKFIYFTYEVCLQMLGSAAQFLGVEFYAAPNLSSSIKECVFSSIEFLPDHRLKTVFHYFLKPLIQWCPHSFYNSVILLLGKLCPFMFQKLSARWEKFKERYGTSVGVENEMTETQEIFEDQLNRLLTREYIDFLGCVLRGKKCPDSTSEAMDEESEPKVQNHSLSSEKLSELGAMLLRTEDLRGVLVYTVFKAIQWLDTTMSNKSTLLCFSIFNQLKQDMLITSEQEATFLLQNALSALSELGEHEINQGSLIALCLYLYESLKPSFPGLKNTLLQISGCSTEELEKFESSVFQKSKKPFPEKKKKEMFRSLVSEVIGKNVGQYFKNDVKIKDLPLFFLPSKKKNQPLDSLNDSDLGICSLFS